ncbi:hypothetical protein LJC71_11675, partial [Desulfosarcina sp. OttesenSCG-928-A07]|nr:hypothetical protein [Desulfosarcina sp. OttesenSCG-928-A07]
KLDKTGTGTLTNLGGFTGDVNINAGTIEISTTTFGNVLTGAGTLAVNCTNATDTFIFGNTVGDAFTGTVNMRKGSISLDDTNTYAVLQNAGLKLGADGSTTITQNRSIKSLAMNGGTLKFDVESITPGGVLTLGTLDATGGGTIMLDLNKAAVTTGAKAQSLYDYATAASSAQQKLVGATTLTGDGTQLAWKDYNGLDLGAAQTRNIEENGTNTGVASFDYLGTAKGDGLYLGYGLAQIEALAGQSVTLDSNTATAATPTINAKLTGTGGFTFSGTKNVSVGNAASDYTGATTIKDSHTVTMLADNAFGSTSSLSLTNAATLDMNGNSQTVADINVANDTEIIVGRLTLTNGGTIAGKLSGTGTMTQSGGTLAYSGTQTDGSFVQTAGTFNAANGATLNNATFEGKVNPAGTLNITGDANFDNAEVDFGLLTQGNKIAVGGKASINSVTARVDATGIINSNSYTLLEFGTIATSGIHAISVSGLGENRGGDYIDNNALKFDVIVGNTTLTWNGSSNTWNDNDRTNLNWSTGNINTYFKTGDNVIFDDSSANKDVFVAPGGVSVGTMEVKDDYNFTGGTITASGAVTIAAGKTLGLNISDSAPMISAASLDFNSTGKLNITGYAPGSTTNFTVPFQQATAITTSAGVTNFNPAVTVLNQASVDFLTASARLSDNGMDVLVETGLTWYSTDPNRPAHGDFTIGDGETFTLGAALIDQPGNAGWDGASLNKKGEGTLTLSGANTATGLFTQKTGAVHLASNWAGNYTQNAGTTFTSA